MIGWCFSLSILGSISMETLRMYVFTMLTEGYYVDECICKDGAVCDGSGFVVGNSKLCTVWSKGVGIGAVVSWCKTYEYSNGANIAKIIHYSTYMWHLCIYDVFYMWTGYGKMFTLNRAGHTDCEK